MSFPFNIYLMAAAAAFATTLLSLPLWRKWSFRVGLVDDPGHRKIHHTPVSLSGGLAVMTGLILPLGAGAVFYAGLPLLFNASLMDGVLGPWFGSAARGPLGYGIEARALQLTVMIGGALAMVLLGWMDDKYELRPAIKFGGQLFIATSVAAAGIRITLFVDNVLFSYAITVLWILTVTNAFNFMDNMNGLCGGLGVIAAWCFAWSAAVQGQYLAALLGFLICGALLGFLPFNFPKASSFLGDAGSHLVGYLMAVLAILPHFYSETHPRKIAVIGPLLILAVPLADLVWVVILRWRKGLPFYVGDTNHLSHRLVRRGLTKTTAVLCIWLLSAAISTLPFLL